MKYAAIRKYYFEEIRINTWGLVAYLAHSLENPEYLGELLVVFLKAYTHMGKAVTDNLTRGKGVIILDYKSAS